MSDKSSLDRFNEGRINRNNKPNIEGNRDSGRGRNDGNKRGRDKNNEGKDNNKGSKEDKKSKGKKKGIFSSHLLIAVAGMFILYFAFNPEKIPFDITTDGRENVNKFFILNEGNNRFPWGKERTGNDIYDKNQIPHNEIYNIGDNHYLIYVYTQIDFLDDPFNEALIEYEDINNSLNVYKIKDTELNNNSDYDDVIQEAPFIIELIDLGESAEELRIIKDVDVFKDSFDILTK